MVSVLSFVRHLLVYMLLTSQYEPENSYFKKMYQVTQVFLYDCTKIFIVIYKADSSFIKPECSSWYSYENLLMVILLLGNCVSMCIM